VASQIRFTTDARITAVVFCHNNFDLAIVVPILLGKCLNPNLKSLRSYPHPLRGKRNSANNVTADNQSAVLTMRGPSQERSPPFSKYHFVVAFVLAILVAIRASPSNLCDSSCLKASYSSSTLCDSLWKLQKLVRPSTVRHATDSSIHDDDANVPEQKQPIVRKKRNPFAKLFRRRSKQKKTAIISQYYPTSVTSLDHWKPSRSESALGHELSRRARATIPNFDERVAAVPWGGPGGSSWWSGDGSHLLHAYLKIMKWPRDLETNFPLKMCLKKCNAELAIAHTLEWREKYKPWCMSPSGIQENIKGFVYTRGYSPSLTGDKKGHALVWLRLSIHRGINPVQWVRAIMNSLERAVGDSLKRSNGKVGRFNCVVDAKGFTLSMLFAMVAVKRMIIMLQDHFPDRLGVVLLANLSKPAQIVLGLIKPLITKEVRDKILILPDDPEPRQAMLDAVVLPEYLPDYLGGMDTWRFDIREYYSSRNHHCTETETTEYLTSMPYHAN
jgi:CRAL/TRIO domain